MARQDLHLSPPEPAPRRSWRWLLFLVVLVRDQGLAYLFGAGNFADTYNLAAWSTDTAAIALSSSERLRRSRLRPVLLAGIAVAGIALAKPVATWAIPVFRMLPLKLNLAVQLTQILFLVLPLLVLGGLTSLLFQGIGMISGLLLAGALLPSFPGSGFKPILGMVLGWVLGGIIYSTRFMKDGFSEAPGNPALAPSAIPIAVGISVILAATKLVGRGTGAISWLSYAAHVSFAVGGLFWAICLDGKKSPDVLRSQLHRWMEVLLPICAGLVFLRIPVARLLFQRGRFYPEDAVALSRVLAVDAVALFAAVFVRITSGMRSGAFRFSPWLTLAISTAVSCVLAVRFGYWALAIGPAVAGLFQCGCVFPKIHREMTGFSRSLAIQLILCAGTGELCWVSFDHLDSLIPGFRLLTLGLIFLEGFAILAFARSRPGLMLRQ